MGSIARAGRCDRFEKEFNDDYVKKLGLGEGSWRVEKQFLATEEVNEVTRLVVVLKNDKGETATLLRDFTVFDPDAPFALDLAESLSEDLGVTVEDAKKRLMKAELFDEGDFKE